MMSLWFSPCFSHSLNLFVGSKHFSDLNEEFNENNPGIGINLNRGNIIYGLGAYINSYKKDTIFTHVGIKKRWFNIKAMLVTGYQDDISCQRSVCASVAMGIEFKRVNLEYIPGYSANTLALHLRMWDF